LAFMELESNGKFSIKINISIAIEVHKVLISNEDVRLYSADAIQCYCLLLVVIVFVWGV